jgi:hypothetical protein
MADKRCLDCGRLILRSMGGGNIADQAMWLGRDRSGEEPMAQTTTTSQAVGLCRDCEIKRKKASGEWAGAWTECPTGGRKMPRQTAGRMICRR